MHGGATVRPGGPAGVDSAWMRRSGNNNYKSVNEGVWALFQETIYKRPATMNLSNPLRPAGAAIPVAAAVSMLLAASVARAADDPSTNSAPGNDSVVLQEITVTATRRAEELNKVPVNITAYTPEQMDDQGIRQVDD